MESDNETSRKGPRCQGQKCRDTKLLDVDETGVGLYGEVQQEGVEGEIKSNAKRRSWFDYLDTRYGQ